MAATFDHLVLAGGGLTAVSAEFSAAGFSVVVGGRHQESPTANALISCRGDSYLELVAFARPAVAAAATVLARTPVWDRLLARQPAVARRLARGLTGPPGLIAFAVRVASLDDVVAALRELGFAVPEPALLRRSKPDGTVAAWRVAAPDDTALPLLLHDVTPLAARIPPAGADAPAITRVTVAVPDRSRYEDGYHALFGGQTGLWTWQAGGTTIAVDTKHAGPPAFAAVLEASRLPPRAMALGLSLTSPLPGRAAAQRLAGALRHRTELGADNAFTALGAHLEAAFPLVHARLELTRFGHSRLYRWPGTRPGHTAALLLAHLDVVGIGDPGGWTHPPFAGVVDDEFVWGRGAIDDKSRVLAILEAAEAALADGYSPSSTLYFAFGHDEETTGAEGAAVIAAHLHAQGVHADFVLDEGSVIVTSLAGRGGPPVAAIAVGEKGYATVRLRARDTGGHSSMPPPLTAVGRIARAVSRIQDNPMPLRLTPAVADMVARLGPALGEPHRTLLRLSGDLAAAAPVIARVLAASPETAALVRTTIAPTVISGGVAANVLPQTAEALLNFRILPGDCSADVLRHCRQVIADPAVTAELDGPAVEPSPLSPAHGPAFELLAAIVAEVMPGAIVTPGIVPAATDTGRYHRVARHRYNFAPVLLDSTELARIHGTDERISHTNYARLIEFYRLLLARL